METIEPLVKPFGFRGGYQLSVISYQLDLLDPQ